MTGDDLGVVGHDGWPGRLAVAVCDMHLVVAGEELGQSPSRLEHGTLGRPFALLLYGLRLFAKDGQTETATATATSSPLVSSLGIFASRANDVERDEST